VRHATVHELLHGILVEEGYHKIAARLPDSVHKILSNELQHPEIFRRMESYGLDMTPYWIDWDMELRASLDEMKHAAHDPHVGFAHFPRIFTWFFFRQVSEPYLAEYRDLDPALFQSAQAAFEDTKRVGFEDVQNQRESIERFKNHWSQYCKRHLPKDSLGVQLTTQIGGSAIKPLIDFERDRPGVEIMRLLKESGLRV
jgi:hypothetical protein